MTLTRAELLHELHARLDESLVVEDPHPYGDGIIVQRTTVDGEERVVVVQPGGPHFAVTVTEATLEVNAG